MEVSVSKIKVGERIRQFDNSSGGIKESIAKLGLLEPIVLNQDFELLCGLRRLQACKELGWEKINCVIIQTANELDKLDIELEENIKRRNLSDHEVSVGLLKR